MTKKKRTSLDTIFNEEGNQSVPPEFAAPPPAGRSRPAIAQELAGERSRRRTFEIQHKKQSVYLGKPVYEQLRRLAFDERRKMHDYLIEGLDSVFRKRGLPSIDELEKEGA
jgi:hypothetical protein